MTRRQLLAILGMRLAVLALAATVIAAFLAIRSTVPA